MCTMSHSLKNVICTPKFSTVIKLDIQHTSNKQHHKKTSKYRMIINNSNTNTWAKFYKHYCFKSWGHVTFPRTVLVWPLNLQWLHNLTRLAGGGLVTVDCSTSWSGWGKLFDSGWGHVISAYSGSQNILICSYKYFCLSMGIPGGGITSGIFCTPIDTPGFWMSTFSMDEWVNSCNSTIPRWSRDTLKWWYLVIDGTILNRKARKDFQS